MVQFFDPGLTARQQAQSKLGEAIGIGVSKRFAPPEQMVQKGLLQEAFGELKGAEEGSYLEKLAAIAPQLMTTPGGAELLSTLAPILQKAQQSKNVAQFIENKRAGLSQDPLQDQVGTEQEAEVSRAARAEEMQPESDVDIKMSLPAYIRPEDKFRYPPSASKQEQEEEKQYPQTTAGPETMKVLSPKEMEKQAYDLMQGSMATGSPMTFNDAMNVVQKQNDTIQNYNDQILKEQQLRDDANKEMNQGIVQRAINDKIVDPNNPEELTVLEKLAYKHRFSKNPAEQWEKVRTDFRNFANAREAIKREASLPGKFSELGRKMLGTYKDKETVQRNLQPFLDPYREFGLFDEARALLTSELGMGIEDAETTLFPFDKKELNDLNKFSKNKLPLPAVQKVYPDFPGDFHKLRKPEDFQKFKNELGTYLEKYPKSNLIALRGRLNQDKKYAWQDVSRGLNELMEEDRFTPDLIQNHQLNIINNAPLPGLTQIFRNYWKGTR